MKKAFTMVELIFVIVILGILAMVALPRLAGSKKDAEITRAKAEIAAIRSAIQTYRGANLLSQKPGSGYPEKLDKKTIEEITNGTKLGSNWTVRMAIHLLLQLLVTQLLLITIKPKEALLVAETLVLCAAK